MNKTGLSGLKSLDQYKSMYGSSKTFSMPSRQASDSSSSGSFANLKLTAEKLIKEQASVKTDIEMANSKLKKSTDHIRVLEEKLQYALNENSKHRVKQKEDEKLWKGLESKFWSTKTLCDQLTETLQHLAGQVQGAEKDKESFENKLSASSLAIDDLNNQMKDLSLKLECAETTIKNREEQVKELGIEKGKQEELHRKEQHKTLNFLKEKDVMIKQFKDSVAANKLELESINCRLIKVNLELRLKEDESKCLQISLENLNKEKSDLQSSNEDFSRKLVLSQEEITHLKAFVQMLVAKLIDLDEKSLILSDKFDQLNSVYGSCFKLVEQERDLAAKLAQQQYDKIHDRLMCITSEKDASQLLNEEFINTISDLQRVQESLMVQHAEECQITEERIRRLESQAEVLSSKKTEIEMLVTKLEDKIVILSNDSTLSEDKLQESLLKITALQSENEETREKSLEEIEKKAQEIDMLQKEIGNYEQRVDSVDKQVSQLQSDLEEKEQLILQYSSREKQLEDKKAEIQISLASAESKLLEAKKQYDLMLENKQSELSRHLKEISQRNDQAINDIRKKYEVEKQEIINHEKEKADKVVGEMEKNVEQKLAESREESKKREISLQEEHSALVARMQQEHAKKESSLNVNHREELKRAQLQAESQLTEKTTLLGKKHEAEVKTLTLQHEDECRELLKELDEQKSREDRQRALLQLQWRVMGDKPEEQEVNSKKENSTSSKVIRNPDGTMKSQLGPRKAENVEKNIPFEITTQSPNMIDPKHSRKVTHHEYEVETSNGRITKRRKTKRTVMFEDPRKQKKIGTPRTRTPRTAVKGTTGGGHPRPSNIGDLFSEGSLNPYTDDPYAFD